MPFINPRLWSLRFGLSRFVVLAVACTAPLLSHGWEAKPFPLAGPLYTYEQWNKRCGDDHSAKMQWLRELVLHHRIHFRDKDRPYLGYSCLNPSPYPQATYRPCGSLYNRMRAIMFMLRLNVKAKRLMLIKQTFPVPMEMFLTPSGIMEWKTDGLEFPIVHPDPATALIPRLRNGSWDDLRDRLVLWEVDEREDADYPDLPELKDPAFELHCMFHALFQPSERLVKVVQKQFDALKMLPNASYSVVHLRLGARPGDTAVTEWEQALPLVLSSVNCAQGMAAQHNYTGPVLMLTDHGVLRRFLAAGFVQNVTTFRVPLPELRSTFNGTDHLASTMVDIMVMAHARCQLMGNRGSSQIAHWWAGDICFRNVHTCANEFWQSNQMRRALLGRQHLPASHSQHAKANEEGALDSSTSSAEVRQQASQAQQLDAASTSRSSRWLQHASLDQHEANTHWAIGSSQRRQLSAAKLGADCMARLREWWDQEVRRTNTNPDDETPVPDCEPEARQAVMEVFSMGPSAVSGV